MNDLEVRARDAGGQSHDAAVPVSNSKRLAQLESALAHLAPYGGVSFAPLRIRHWRGEAFNGFFVRIDASTWALHVGDCRYVWLDVERDLDGLLPSEAVRAMRPRA
jgi:hypothetical protein